MHGYKCGTNYYRTCPVCGANLDPEEHCKCQDDRDSKEREESDNDRDHD